jgi:hypothetical protein
VTRALLSSHDTPAETGSDLVVDQLAEALSTRGYHIERDIGASNFRVDVGLSRGGDDRLVLGLLVDSEAHYAMTDPMERYHARPAVLEAFGWHLEWLLTKDWVDDREGCLARIDKAFEAARAVQAERANRDARAAQEASAMRTERIAQAARDSGNAPESSPPPGPAAATLTSTTMEPTTLPLAALTLTRGEDDAG